MFKGAHFNSLNFTQRFLIIIVAGGCAWVAGMAAGEAGTDGTLTNLVANPGFEIVKNGLPQGWGMDEHTKGKGAVEVVKDKEKALANVLKLTPNEHNTVVEQPFGLTQTLPADQLRGKKIHIQASLKAIGGAEASVVVFEMGEDDRLINYTLLLSFASDDFRVYESFLELSDEAQYLIIHCATSSRQGEVYFDNLEIYVDPDRQGDRSMVLIK